MACWPYGPDPILISAQTISVISLAVSIGGLWLSWDLWILGLMSTIILLSMACTTIDQSAVISAGIFAAICAISHLVVAPLAHELRTPWRIAGFAAGVGWLIAAILTFRLAWNLRLSLPEGNAPTDTNGLVVDGNEGDKGKHHGLQNSEDLHETV